MLYKHGPVAHEAAVPLPPAAGLAYKAGRKLQSQQQLSMPLLHPGTLLLLVAPPRVSWMVGIQGTAIHLHACMNGVTIVALQASAGVP